ncbi:MAG: DinB family protein [Chloroflexi bacterium]|nr:DinB family protein [Chloroflexota bacterium]
MTPEQQALRDALAAIPGRLAACLSRGTLEAETFPTWSWVEPGLLEGSGTGSFEGALAVFGDFRAATIARLDALDADGWTRRCHHATFGELDVAALMGVALVHDAEHLAQIQG